MCITPRPVASATFTLFIPIEMTPSGRACGTEDSEVVVEVHLRRGQDVHGLGERHLPLRVSFSFHAPFSPRW